MISLIYPNTQIVLNGNTGSIISSNSINSPTITTSSLKLNNSNGVTGNILSKNNDTLIWIEPSNTIPSNLNMNNANIINTNTLTSNSLNTSTITTSTFTNQTAFSSAPTSITPSSSSQLTTKQYVDNMINEIYTLYLNNSPPQIVFGNTGYFKLSPTVSGVTGIGITGTTVTTTPTLISSFISDPINITNIPESLWILNLYAGITSTTNIFTLYFELYTFSSNGTITLIGTSANSGDINTTPTGYPDLYKMPLPITSPVTTNLTDRFLLRLYFISTLTSPGTTYSVFYENNSYLEIIANNNQNQTNISGYGISNLNMNGYTITSTNNMKVYSGGAFTLTVGNGSSVINIGTDTSVTTDINLGYSGAFTINSRYNYFHTPMTPMYDTLPSTQHLGQIVTYTRPGITGFVSGSEISSTYSVPFIGIWGIFVTVGIYVATTGGTISRLFLRARQVGSNYVIIRQEYLGTQTPTTIGYGNILNGYGIMDATTDLRRDFTITQLIDFSGGTYTTYNSSENLYILRAIRIG